MKTHLDATGGEPPDWWLWNDLRKRLVTLVAQAPSLLQE